MSINIIAHPHGRGAIPLVTPDNDAPEFSEAVPGGYRRAKFSTVLKDGWRERLLDAPVYFYAPSGMVWAGRVWSISKPIGGVSKIRCNGWQTTLTRDRREALYCDTSLLPWTIGRTIIDVRKRDVTAQMDSALLRLIWEEGTTYPANAYEGFQRRIPVTDKCRVTFGWTRASTDYRVILYSGITGSGSTGEPFVRTVEWAEQNASGALSGSETVDISGTNVDWLIFTGSDIGGGTPGSDECVTFHTIKVFGVPDVTTINPSNVLDDCLDELPTDDLPAGDAHRAWMASDTTTVEPLIFNARSSEADMVAEILRYTTKDFGFWVRRINGEYAPVPVFAAKPLTADYVAFVDGENTSARLGGDDMTELASAVRVNYSDVEGRSAHTDRTDTDTSHYLVAIDRDKVEAVYAETSSTTLANTIGDNYLDDYGEMQISGTIDVLGAIKDENGADVLPCEITAGRRIRLVGMEEGSVEARIVQVEKTGMFRARLHVSTRPYMLDVELARLAKHTIAG